MDPEQEFLQTARDTVAKLNERGIAPRDYDGHLGWNVDYRSKETTRGNYPKGWFEMYHEDAYLILKTDGTFVDVGKWYTEGTDGDSPVNKFANPVGTTHFVGQSGKPFATWIEKLQRYPYSRTS